jgi:hypothetical protein
MSRKMKMSVFLVVIFFILNPCTLLGLDYLYVREKTRSGLISQFGLSESLSYEEVSDYLDCEHVFTGLSKEEFIKRLDSVGGYNFMPFFAFEEDLSDFGVRFHKFNLVRYYEMHGGYLSGIRRPLYGEGDTRVDCPG